VIARIWHGWTTPANASRYQALLETKVLPEIAAKGIVGYRGADVLRHVKDPDANEVEFITMLWFDELKNVQAFTGEDYEVAHVPAEARELLLRFDARSRHYDHVRDRGTA